MWYWCIFPYCQCYPVALPTTNVLVSYHFLFPWFLMTIFQELQWPCPQVGMWILLPLPHLLMLSHYGASSICIICSVVFLLFYISSSLYFFLELGLLRPVCHESTLSLLWSCHLRLAQNRNPLGFLKVFWISYPFTDNTMRIPVRFNEKPVCACLIA